MIRILIADDHAILRRGLKEILAGEFKDAIFGEAGNAQEVLTEVRTTTGNSNSTTATAMRDLWLSRTHNACCPSLARTVLQLSLTVCGEPKMLAGLSAIRTIAEKFGFSKKITFLDGSGVNQRKGEVDPHRGMKDKHLLRPETNVTKAYLSRTS